MQLRSTLTHFAVAAALGLGLGTAADAQTVRQVNFADVQNQTLDLLIAADVEALGGNTDGVHLVYELERERPFLFSGQLEYEDIHLELRPQSGDGARPIILQRLGDGGETVDQLIRMRGSAELTLNSLVLTGRTNQGTFNDRIIRTSGENRITMDSVLVDEVGQAIIRINGENERIFVRNSEFNRIGRPSNPDNGRLFDNRSDGLDSLVVEHNRITNVTSRFYRSSASDLTNYLRFDQNTFVGSGQHGFDVREGVREFVFTNNIVADAIFLGRDYDAHYDSLGNPLDDARHVIDVDSVDADGGTVTIANNNFFRRSSSVDALPPFELDDDTGEQGDSLTTIAGFYISANLREAIGATDGAGTGTSNFSEELDFETGPASYEQFIVAVAEDITDGNEIPAADPFDNDGLEVFDLYSGQNLGSSSDIDRFVEGYDLCYDESAQSATASGGGGAIGAVEGCEGLMVSALQDLVYGLPARAYPNPTPGLLTVELEEATAFTVEVYDAIGRQVLRSQDSGVRAEVDLSGQPAGTYRVRVVDADARASVLTVVRQ